MYASMQYNAQFLRKKVGENRTKFMTRLMFSKRFHFIMIMIIIIIVIITLSGLNPTFVGL